jgi:hypothetical protein
MARRRIVLIVLGLLAAAATGLVAAQLLAVGLGLDPPISRDVLGSVTDQVRTTPRPGVAMLAGVALAGVALVLAILWFTDLVGPRRRTVTLRKAGGGVTKVDRPTLEASLERELNHLDARTKVAVSVRRRGRTRVVVRTGDPTRTGPSGLVADRLRELVAQRHLPLTVTSLVVVPATGRARRKRVG